MKVKCIKLRPSYGRRDYNEITIGKIYEVEWAEYRSHYKVVNDLGYEFEYETELFEEVKENEGLTFTEVIASIQEGEVYESIFKDVEMRGGDIFIIQKNGENFGDMIALFDDILYSKKVQEMDFELALKLYYDGKIIKSLKSGCEYKIKNESHYKKENGDIAFYEWHDIILKGCEMLGKWVEVK